MKNQASEHVIRHLGAEDAWKLWHQLNRLAESLWDAYEQQFLEFCIKEAKDQAYPGPLPFDKPL